ncbi:MAG: hypothetical protein FRX49_11234 [Trebouxia sp. A1-2]|nr:MAG: hypothetical protein FRX49_11231 [Trebouxia sp. A1-2]KAA6418878.1 MAG: hypothetical protein FRX49_11234 [Trebouxia sp. A1-2]
MAVKTTTLAELIDDKQRHERESSTHGVVDRHWKGWQHSSRVVPAGSINTKKESIHQAACSDTVTDHSSCAPTTTTTLCIDGVSCHEHLGTAVAPAQRLHPSKFARHVWAWRFEQSTMGMG